MNIKDFNMFVRNIFQEATNETPKKIVILDYSKFMTLNQCKTTYIHQIEYTIAADISCIDGIKIMKYKQKYKDLNLSLHDFWSYTITIQLINFVLR